MDHPRECFGEVRNLLESLSGSLPVFPPIQGDILSSLTRQHQAKDFHGMMRTIRILFKIRVFVDIRVVDYDVDGSLAWMDQESEYVPSPLGEDHSYYIKLLRGTLFMNRRVKEMSFAKASCLIAHELSHVVLFSQLHPHYSNEKAVDLTAMMLGFRELYVEADAYLSHKEIAYAAGAIARLQQHSLRDCANR